MKRIIRVKFLYRAAVEQVDSAHPFAAGMAVSLLQDAVEAMAHEAAASVHAVMGAKAGFLDHWRAVADAASGRTLPYQIEMTELNTARVGFKHHGVNPALADAEKHVLAAHRFLVDTARIFFDAEFDQISEADLISDDSISRSIRSAEGALATDDPTRALEHCRTALDFVEKLMNSVVVVSAEDRFAPPIPSEWRAAAAGLINWTLRRFAALEKSVVLSVLNVNPADYWFLYDSLPQKTHGGTFYWPQRRSPIPIQTAARARTCIRIVTNIALRVERASVDLKRIALQSGAGEEQEQLRELRERGIHSSATDAPSSLGTHDSK